MHTCKTFMRVRLFACIVHAHAHALAQALAHTHAHVHACTLIRIRIHVRVRKYGSMHDMNAYVCICMHACIHVWIHICTHLSCNHQKRKQLHTCTLKMYVCRCVCACACACMHTLKWIHLYAFIMNTSPVKISKDQNTHLIMSINEVHAYLYMCVYTYMHW